MSMKIPTLEPVEGLPDEIIQRDYVEKIYMGGCPHKWSAPYVEAVQRFPDHEFYLQKCVNCNYIRLIYKV